MALVFNCPRCGAQNFVSPQRLKHREREMVCWVCRTPFSWEFLEGIMGSRAQGNKKDQGMERKGGVL